MKRQTKRRRRHASLRDRQEISWTMWGTSVPHVWSRPIERNHRRRGPTSRISRLRSDQRRGAIGHSKVQVIPCRSLSVQTPPKDSAKRLRRGAAVVVVIGLVTIGIFIIGRWDKTRRVPTLRQSQAKDMQRTTTTPSPPPRSTSAALPLTPFKPDRPLSRVFTEEALAVDTIEVAEMTIADLYLVNNRIPSRLVSMAQQAVDRGQAATNYFLLS